MKFIEKYLHVINKEIDNIALPKEPRLVYEPISYFLALGGKRIRPVLALMSHKLFDNNFQKALPIAKLVELFHNFSLIHDDIMDDAPLRRGQLTVHQKWNSNIAILSGDMMLIKAYQQLEDIDENAVPKIFKVFNQCAIKVCEGQQYDMDFEYRDNVSVDEYINMIYLKTSTLLEHTLEMGAILANSNQHQKQNLKEFGKNLGIAFQLRDDLLDVFGSGDFGKQHAGDILSNKKTFLMLKAFEKANEEQRKKLHYWLEKNQFNSNEKINAVINIFNDLEIKQETENRINYYNDLASNALENLMDVNIEVKNEFKELQLFLMNRTI